MSHLQSIINLCLHVCDHLRVCARGHNLRNKKISHVLESLNSLVFYESCSDGSGNEASVVGFSNFMDFFCKH